MAHISCVGLACLDYLFSVPTLPSGGGKSFADNYKAAPGGPAAAAAIAVAALGHRASFIGRLGDDQTGREVVRHLASRNVDTAHIRLIENETSQVSSVIIDRSGERQIINYSSSTLDSDPSWIPEAIIQNSDFVLADVRWPEGAQHALRLARTHNIPSLLDADITPVDISGLVDLATYTVFSERGLEMVSGVKNVAEALSTIAAVTSTWPAVTAGERGCFWLEEGQLRNSPAEAINAVDTCGAGDVFHGAFAAAMAEQMQLHEAMRFAGVTAALKCLSFGGSLGAPDRAEVDRYLAGKRTAGGGDRVESACSQSGNKKSRRG